eukprot:UN09786
MMLLMGIQIYVILLLQQMTIIIIIIIIIIIMIIQQILLKFRCWFGCGDQVFLLTNALRERYQQKTTSATTKAIQNNDNNDDDYNNNIATYPNINIEIHGVNLSHQQTAAAVDRIPVHFPTSQ